MPRLRVILLDQHADDSSTYNVVLWADVPAARQIYYANPNKVSAWPSATGQDNTNLQNGSVSESVVSQRITQGTGLPQIEGILQQLWQSYQNFITNNNPWQRYNTTWHGTT